MRKALFLALTIMLIGASCTPIKVVSNFDQGIELKEFKTFKIELDKHAFPVQENIENHKLLEAEISRKMAEMGFTKEGDPDLVLSYFIIKETKTGEVHTGENPDDADYEFLVEVFTYKEGTLVLDIYDKAKKNVIWHGVLSRTVHENKRTAEHRIKRNVNALFKRITKDMNIISD